MFTYEALKSVNERVNRVEVRKGKFYADVAARVQGFRELEMGGSIITEIVSITDGVCICKATILDADGKVLATGHAYEREGSSQINNTSYIENCETSAVGRALGMLGIGSEKSMASAEEMANALAQQEEIEAIRIEILKLANGDANRVDRYIAAKTVTGRKLDDLNLKELMLFRDMIAKETKTKEAK